MPVENILVILMFATFILGLFTGFPIAFVLGGVGVIFAGVGYYADLYLGTMTGLDYMMLGMSVNRIFKYMDNWVLVALPMFIFMGLMLDRSGIAEKMMDAIQELFGKVRGGLAVTVTSIGIILAASTGIIGASVVLLGLLSLPAMLKQGYSKTLALGTIAGSGTLGILIPPSIMLVIMADQLGLSVGDLFMGALFPGLILGALYISYILIYCKLNPEAAPLPEGACRPDFKVIWKVFKTVLPAAGLILAVLGSIFAGITTPTEASGVGALGATLLALFNRKLTLKAFKEVLHGTYNTTAYIFAIFLGASVFALTLRGLGGDEFIEGMLTGLPFGPYGIMAFILGIVFLLGFFLDWIEITLIVLPLVAPVVEQLGFDLVWFTVLFAVCLQTSFLTPPVGFALFYFKGVAPREVDTACIYRGVAPFVALQLLGLALLFAWPRLATWLPSLASATPR